MMICDACVYENADNLAFCEACGTELTASPTPPSPPPPTQAQTPTVDPFAATPIEPVTTPPLPTTIKLSENPATLENCESLVAKLVTKTPNAPIPEFMLDETNLLVGRFDPDQKRS